MNKYLELEYPYYSYSKKFDKKEIIKNIKNYEPTILNKVPNNLKNKNLTKYNNNYFILHQWKFKTPIGHRLGVKIWL